jgi:hypothetical protein
LIENRAPHTDWSRDGASRSSDAAIELP